MSTELKDSISAKEFYKLKKQIGIGGKLAEMAISFLEKYFGTNILLEIPPTLQEINPELFNAIETAEKLQALGIIKKIERQPKYSDEPFFYKFSITTQQTANTGSGSDFFSENSAIWRAIGEAVERDLWAKKNDLLKNIQHLSYEKIAGRALNIFKLAGFSEKQKEDTPQLNFNKHTVFGWVPAISLTRSQLGKNILCPAQLINAYYFKKNTPNKEPLLRRCITTGVATASGNLEEAITKGILEVIERDAYIIAYLNKISPPVIDFEYLSYQDEKLEKVYKMFKRYQLEVYLVKLPTDFSANVISAVIVDKSGNGPTFVIGNSAKFDIKSAILSALAEAFSIRLVLKKNWESRKEIALPELKKFKQFDRMFYWAKPENASQLNFMIQGEKVKIDLETEDNFFDTKEKTESKEYYKEKLQLLTKELEKKSYEACYVELSTPAVKKIGLRSVQVIIPDLQPIHLEEEFPCFGGKRLNEVPKITGYIPANELNQAPHPFG